jgi:hypothetical protein
MVTAALKTIKITIPLLVFCMVLFSCKKDPGEGGTSSVTGKVYVKNYNSTFTVLEEEYYGQDVDVYIIYGDDVTYGDHTTTNYDGVYEFQYLRPGTYHIYAYSKDSTMQTGALIPVIKEITIDKKREEVQVPEILIFK